MKIVSLLPSATEIVYALGLGEHLVAVTHECDYPAAARTKPVITRSVLSNGMTSAEIDSVVRARLTQGKALYTIDSDLLHALRPDLILTQQLCDVCAVDYDDVLAAVRALPTPGPEIVNLEPNTLADVVDTVRTVGQAAGRAGEADKVCRSLWERVEKVSATACDAPSRPRVVLLEWLDPLFCGGHWMPELIRTAGGEDKIGRMHRPSTRVTWPQVCDFAPEVLVLAPCGFPVERTKQDVPGFSVRPGYEGLPAVRQGRVFLANGSEYFSRPGPRLVDGLELLATLVHPDLFGPWAGPADAVLAWT